MSTEFNYKEKSVPKLTPEFKSQFIVKIGKGKTEAIKADGLLVLAHEKGIKSLKTEIVQFPNSTNDYVCIAQTVLIGYDWSPIEEKIIEVEYSDFADASAANCGPMTAASYPRMASTRSISRTLRKYTNVDMVSSEELAQTIDVMEEPISQDQLLRVKTLITEKKLTQEMFSSFMIKNFGHTNYLGLSAKEALALISKMEALEV